MKSLADVPAWARLDDTGMARSSDMVRWPRNAVEEATPSRQGTICLLLLMPVVWGRICCRPWRGWGSWFEKCSPVSGSRACCARRSSSVSISLGPPYCQPRCGERCRFLLCHLCLGGTRRHVRQGSHHFLVAGGPSCRRGGGSCRRGPQSFANSWVPVDPVVGGAVGAVVVGSRAIPHPLELVMAESVRRLQWVM